MSAEAPSLAWIRTHLGREAELGRALTGGVTSRVHLVADGTRRAVLKQVTNPHWLLERRMSAPPGQRHDPDWDLVPCTDFLPDWRSRASPNNRLEAWVRYLP
jgi:hypothetical protein